MAWKCFSVVVVVAATTVGVVTAAAVAVDDDVVENCIAWRNGEVQFQFSSVFS